MLLKGVQKAISNMQRFCTGAQRTFMAARKPKRPARPSGKKKAVRREPVRTVRKSSSRKDDVVASSSRSTISAPAQDIDTMIPADAAALKFSGAESLGSAFPFNTAKPSEIG